MPRQGGSAVGMKSLILILALLVASCNREEQPEAPTPAETKRLNDAEEMLNNLANEEGPATEAADPSVNSQ